MKLTANDQPALNKASARSISSDLAEEFRLEAAAFGNASSKTGCDRQQGSDRLLRHLKTLFADLGITRLSRITGLDTIGIPVWAAIRPNARTLSVSQGKGLTDDAAAISALMECFELAMSERRHPRVSVASRDELETISASIIALGRYVRRGMPVPSRSQTLRWVEGFDLLSGRPVMVPEDVIRLDDDPDPEYAHPFWQTSDGYGAGATLTEATLHGLCECVERDALALASFRTPKEVGTSEVVPASLGSAELDWAADKIGRAGLSLRLYDITSNLKIPSFLALVAPRAIDGHKPIYTELASGTGAHPNAGRAAFRAVVEAAQTRLTTIAGARDDFDPALYRSRLPKDLEMYLGPSLLVDTTLSGRFQSSRLHHPAEQLDWSITRLRAAGIQSAIVVSFETERTYGVSMVRVLVPELEGDPGSKNRRPGRRALASMLGAR